MVKVKGWQMVGARFLTVVGMAGYSKEGEQARNIRVVIN